MLAAQPCPCSSGAAYDVCCGPLHRGEHEAATAEQLMRARYSAYALNEQSYLFRSWHPRTRPDDLGPTPGLTWTGLEVLAAERGGPEDDDGIVEFVARFLQNGEPGAMHERSTFSRRAGRWVYLAPAD